MSALSASSRAAVFVGVQQPLVLQDFPLPTHLAPGAALCRVRLSTICGSDLHTTSGRRVEPCPSILGHESVGEIVALGGPLADGWGTPLAIGDRVTWTIMAACGECVRCRRGLPQKCLHLLKYGHTRCDQEPALTGGYAEHLHLQPGTTVFRVPDALPDELAAPANCALATVVHGLEAIPTEPGDTVLIQGAGLLGVYLVALVRAAGAKRVLVTDLHAARLKTAQAFGADAVLATQNVAPSDVTAWIARESGGEVDAAYEVCGDPLAVTIATRTLRVGGRLLIAGLVTPASNFTLDGNDITRRTLTIRGIHNYRPEHLGRGLAFLEETRERYPYRNLIGSIYPLADINAAFDAARSGRHVRVAVRCAE